MFSKSYLIKRTVSTVRLLFLTGAYAMSAVSFAQQSDVESPEQLASESAEAAPSPEQYVEPQNTSTAVLSPEQWLTRLAEANRTGNFEVSYVVTRPGQEVIPYLWRHAILEDGTEVEQLNLQNGPGQEMIRLNNVVSVFEPDAQPYSIYATAIAGPVPSDLLYDPLALTDGYQFITVGRTRVSGRAAQQIRIVSRDNNRYNYQLWLDEQTGMLLKLNMVDLQGTLLEQVQVTGVNLTEAPPTYFNKINPNALPTAVAMTPQSRRHEWDVSFLPLGMQEVKRETRRLALTGQVVEYKLFSDGLVDVSVYVQPAQDALDSDVLLRNSTNTFLSLTNGQVQITVIGKIPPATANEIAHSLSASGAKG